MAKPPGPNKVRILGIDPGSRCTGYGIIDLQANHAVHVTHGEIKVTGATPAARLHYIFERINDLIEQYRPAEGAIERVFMHKNADSALKLGQARGAALVAMTRYHLPVSEYTANQVKQATVGRGHAAKHQVQHMIRVLLCLREAPPADAADALAVALCHGHTRQVLERVPGTKRVRGGRLS